MYEATQKKTQAILHNVVLRDVLRHSIPRARETKAKLNVTIIKQKNFA